MDLTRVSPRSEHSSSRRRGVGATPMALTGVPPLMAFSSQQQEREGSTPGGSDRGHPPPPVCNSGNKRGGGGTPSRPDQGSPLP